MDTVNKRLAAIRERLGVNKSAFAGLIGIEVSRYNKLENGKGIPAGDALMLMAENLPTLNLTWLLTGEGSMFRDDKVLVPADPIPAKVEATSTLSVVAESDQVKELKEQVRELREHNKLLTELLRSDIDLSELKKALSFSPGERSAAKTQKPQMRAVRGGLDGMAVHGEAVEAAA
ncbi:helix-turn-helix domain-containing protein [Hymenobacter sediminis]|uniref:helix-turn-helix domain-containing protein n=1 Tax=Hymenobacter sediminis TaxID=2218621 RepID=UPI000DA69F0B|nr:helix-turn-helix domain-containing protein [Hymenobacter sediminis]RPD45469.1 helix-turn-helix domain-containing protein [Hymenobacter sediminis]